MNSEKMPDFSIETDIKPLLWGKMVEVTMKKNNARESVSFHELENGANSSPKSTEKNKLPKTNILPQKSDKIR